MGFSFFMSAMWPFIASFDLQKKFCLGVCVLRGRGVNLIYLLRFFVFMKGFCSGIFGFVTAW